MLDRTYYEESRHPPPESGDAEVEEWDSRDRGEVLVDYSAYMIDERNRTTAGCPVTRRASGGVEEDMLQVTFCLAPPPHVSHFCVSYSSGEPTRFQLEPKILATEGNLALIGLRHSTLINEPSTYIYFVYRAPVLAHGSPELRRLTHPGEDVIPGFNQCYLRHGEVGILRDNIGAGYKIATLFEYWGSGATRYDLCVYDSMADTWTRIPTVFLRPGDAPPEHSSDTVITVGGKMGWVDLWRGILLCDVQEESPGDTRPLCYVPLPEPMQPANDLPLCGFGSFFRDITVCQGLIKFVDMQIHASPGSRVPNGWTAVTWTMAPGDPEFRKDVELHSRDIVNGDCLEQSLFVGHPTLSPRDYDVLYLMTKASLDDDASQVIAVNMKTKTIERPAKFTTQRLASMDTAYMRSTISNYLCADPKGNTKRRGPVLQGSSRKKLRAINPSKDLPPMGEESGDTMDWE
ncbi:unnamed protein product [Alopecurus aequalis]